MRILDLGSLNYDRTYEVHHFVEAKETIKAVQYREFCGGKGLNQSIAIARAGASVFHGGCVGADGEALIRELEQAGVDTTYIQRCDGPSGHAIIQVNEDGQNCIVICGGANDCVSEAYIDQVLAAFGQGDLLLLQNEISNVGYAIRRAHEKGLTVVFNPSPIDPSIATMDLEDVDLFVLNEVEGGALAHVSTNDAAEILDGLRRAFPHAAVVLTMGDQGSWYSGETGVVHQEIYPARAVDTTGAGDTYTGYLLAELSRGRSVEQAMECASAAAAISVGRHGASSSIPTMDEVYKILKIF